MTSRWILFVVLLCLAVFEGLLITMLSHWPSVLDTSKSRVQEALYVSSPVASSAYLFQPRQPRKLLLVVAVLSHAARKARRDAIRETWFSDCRQRTDEVFCAFFTDQAGLDNETSSAVMKESEENSDLVFLEVEGKSDLVVSGAPNDNFRKNICSEDDLSSRIFETFVVKFLACLPLLGFSNI